MAQKLLRFFQHRGLQQPRIISFSKKMKRATVKHRLNGTFITESLDYDPERL